MNSQLYERCSLGHQWGVIPVPRHWDLILLYNDVMKVADTGIQKT
ncbi:MAG: hypothetical protein ACEY3F_02345 [Wolbachia sp.]